MIIKQILIILPNWISKQLSYPRNKQVSCQRRLVSRFLALSVCISTTFCLTACTTAGDAIPQSGPTMAQIYEDAIQKSDGASLDNIRGNIQNPVVYNGTTQLSDYTRTAENETNNLFPLLPNPQIVMYIYPHLAGEDEAPVPGYSTAFTLFEREHYAAVGEK